MAISPILLYIGMLIGAQAFQETPKSHAPAIVLALVPHVAAWGKLQIDNALSAAGTSVAAVGVEKLGQSGILYEGLSVLGGGAILSSLILASVGGVRYFKGIPAGLIAIATGMFIAWVSTALGLGYGGMSLEKLAASLSSSVSPSRSRRSTTCSRGSSSWGSSWSPAGRRETNAMDTPASVPSKAARGVILRI